MHRVSDIYGPIRYTKYEQLRYYRSSMTLKRVAYTAFFNDLDSCY